VSGTAGAELGSPRLEPAGAVVYHPARSRSTLDYEHEYGDGNGNVYGKIEFQTRVVPAAADAIAPDGSEVRILCEVSRGGMAQFTLDAGRVSRAVAHRTIEELWCFVSGRGRMWRRLGDREEVVEVVPGVSISLPAGTHFQFRSDGDEPLVAIGATMPRWPGEGEAYAVEGKWEATV
jgi:mannose-6-phosphate isomerase-like protein (cupin superfamily)